MFAINQQTFQAPSSSSNRRNLLCRLTLYINLLLYLLCPMYLNKNQYPQNPAEYNIFRNDRPSAWYKRQRDRSTDIITHQHQSAVFLNPQKYPSPLSNRKHIPRNNEVLRQRSEMIVHPSKISKDVPAWFKGDTYKYYSRGEYQKLYDNKDLYTIDFPTKTLIQKQMSQRSEIGTPRSRQSDISDNFYFGGGTKEMPIRRANNCKIVRQISPKIGSVETRNFELPRIPLKIGHNQYINTHRAC